MTEAAQREGLAELLGGPRGIVDAGLPGVLFGVAYAAFGQQLGPALWVALGSAAVLFVISLVQRRSVQHSIAGLVGVGIMALVARWTGQAEAFYLPSILKNAGYAAAYAISVLVRWPLLGVFLGPVLGEGFNWRQDPARRRAYARSSWVWCGMFLVRLLVQIPLYLAGAVAALGIAGIFLGIPLFALTVYITWVILRAVPMTKHAPDAPDETAGAESEAPAVAAPASDVVGREDLL